MAWHRDQRQFVLDVRIPWGATAVVSLPDGSADHRVGPGNHHFTCLWQAPDEDPTPRPARNLFGEAFAAGHAAWLKAVEADGGPAVGELADGPGF